MDLYEIKNALTGGKTIYDLLLRVTYYARVSTDKDEQAHSLQAQISYYEDFIRSVDAWTFVSGYIDEGLSGTSVAKREAFLKMIEDAKLKNSTSSLQKKSRASAAIHWTVSSIRRSFSKTAWVCFFSRTT